MKHPHCGHAGCTTCSSRTKANRRTPKGQRLRAALDNFEALVDSLEMTVRVLVRVAHEAR